MHLVGIMYIHIAYWGGLYEMLIYRFYFHDMQLPSSNPLMYTYTCNNNTLPTRSDRHHDHRQVKHTISSHPPPHSPPYLSRLTQTIQFTSPIGHMNISFPLLTSQLAEIFVSAPQSRSKASTSSGVRVLSDDIHPSKTSTNGNIGIRYVKNNVAGDRHLKA